MIDFNLDLSKFTCLIGLNGAGKSTVLQFIDFLSQQVFGDIKGWLDERHSDGTASAGRGLWSEKRQSMLDGFVEEGFSRGVPMIPKPKSEAWLICAVKANPYQACKELEDRSGNDDSPNSLKGELRDILGEEPTRDALNSMVSDGRIDFNRIDMPSLMAFRKRLEDVI